jgi:hypothetical protein
MTNMLLQAKTAPDLIDLFLKFQGTDPLCIRLRIEISRMAVPVVTEALAP